MGGMFETPAASVPAGAVEAALLVVESLDALQGRGHESMPGGPIPPSQLRALLAIERSEGMNLRSLGEALASKAPAVSRLCDRLQADGLLERVPSPNSRREVELRLSRRGHALLAEYRAARVKELQAVLASMSTTDLAHLIRGMAGFRDAVLARQEAVRNTASTA